MSQNPLVWVASFLLECSNQSYCCPQLWRGTCDSEKLNELFEGAVWLRRGRNPWLQSFLLQLTLTLAVQALVWKRKKCDLESGLITLPQLCPSRTAPDAPILYGSLPTPGWYCSQFLSTGEYTHMSFRLAEWTVSNIWLYCWNFSPPPPDSCYHRELPEIHCFFQSLRTFLLNLRTYYIQYIQSRCCLTKSLLYDFSVMMDWLKPLLNLVS